MVRFIKQHFFEQPPSKALEVLERENADLKAKVESLEEEIRKLKVDNFYSNSRENQVY